jgi:hypothetical protein
LLRWFKEQIGLRGTLTCMGEVPSLNLDRDTEYREFIRGIPQPLQENAEIVLKLGKGRVLLHPLQFIIHYHTIIKRFVVRLTDTVVK